MAKRRDAAIALGAMMAAGTALAACGDTGDEPATARVAAKPHPRGAIENCATRSEARFPAASDPRNLVVGPLVLVGAAFTPASVVREFGGNKFPALVRAGHRVTVELSRQTRRGAGLAYGPLPQREVHLHDAHRVVTFISCPRGGPSGSTAGNEPVTFWSGFVLASSPRCVPLAVWVDDEPAPRRVMLRLGARNCE
jgi:hypothetical protein